jgi:hypothetical protein
MLTSEMSTLPASAGKKCFLSFSLLWRLIIKISEKPEEFARCVVLGRQSHEETVQVKKGNITRVNFIIRGGLAFPNKRTPFTVVGTLFSTVLDRAEQVGVRKKTAAFFFDWLGRYGGKT